MHAKDCRVVNIRAWQLDLENAIVLEHALGTAKRRLDPLRPIFGVATIGGAVAQLRRRFSRLRQRAQRFRPERDQGPGNAQAGFQRMSAGKRPSRICHDWISFPLRVA
jgi:hypothetical protein